MASVKPKKVLLLFSRAAMDKKKANPMTLSSLFNAAGKKDKISYHYACYNDLIHQIDAKQAVIRDQISGKKIDDYDLVYHRRWGDTPEIGVSTGIYLDKKDKKQLDEEILRPGAMNKLNQYWRFWQHDLPIPKTVYVPGHLAKQWVDESLEKTFKLPFVMKSVNGTRGKDNYLVDSKSQAQKILKRNKKVDFLMQEMIPNEGDFRVLVCDNKIVMVIKRTATAGTHKNNTSLGGSAEIVSKSTLPKDAQRACIKAAKVFKRNVAGVDLVFDKNNPKKFYFFEVNRAPQIEASSFSTEKVEVLNKYFKSVMEAKK